MKKHHVILALVGIFLLVAVLTNPNQDRHKEIINRELTAYMQKSMQESLTETSNEWRLAGQALGMMLGGAVIDRIIDNLVSTNNFVLFSTSKITWAGETQTIGIGVFGNVFITNKLEDALNNALLDYQ